MRARLSVFIALLSISLAPPSPARAQGAAAIAVFVVALEDAEPLRGALVSVDGVVRGATDARGELTVSGLAPGRHLLAVSALGRRTAGSQLEIPAGQSLELSVALEPEPLALPAVAVLGNSDRDRGRGFDRYEHARELSDFYMRAITSRDGWFATRVDLELFSGGRLTDLLRGVPSVVIYESEHGPVVRIVSATGWVRPPTPTSLLSRPRSPPGCEPDYYLDGRHYAMVGSHDQFRLADMEGVEVYVGRVPMRFNTGRSACGVISIWRRR